jgi:preprotein translocase subunit SecE
VFLVLTGRHLLWPNTTDETYSIIIVVVVVIVIMIIIIIIIINIIKLLGRFFVLVAL